MYKMWVGSLIGIGVRWNENGYVIALRFNSVIAFPCQYYKFKLLNCHAEN